MLLKPNQINDTEIIPCHGVYSDVIKPMPTISPAGLSCYSIKATDNTWNNTPAYITIMGYSAIAGNTIFNIQLGRFVNPLTPNTFADMSIKM